MNNKTLIILAFVAVTGVGVYVWYKKTHPITTTPTNNNSGSTTGNTGSTANNGSTADNLASAWDSLSNLWS